MKKIWMHKARSFKEAEEFDRNYYLRMGPEERLETVQLLREIYFKFKSLLKMKIEKDCEELLRLFNKNRVRYCIIGSYAVAFYAKPRYTKDMDILIDPTIENGKRIAIEQPESNLSQSILLKIVQYSH